MEAEARAKVLSGLASLTKQIADTQKSLAEMMRREDETYKILGMRNPRTKRTYRVIDPEKVAQMRACLVNSLKQVHDLGMGWVSVRTILNMARKEISASDADLKKQLHEMAQENIEVAHNGLRGINSCYRHVPTCQEKGLISQ